MKKLFALVLAFVLLFVLSVSSAEEEISLTSFITKYRLWMGALGLELGDYNPKVQKLTDTMSYLTWDALSVVYFSDTEKLVSADLVVLVNGDPAKEQAMRAAAFLGAFLCPLPTGDYQALVDDMANIVRPVYADLFAGFRKDLEAQGKGVVFHTSKAGLMTVYGEKHSSGRQILTVSNMAIAGAYLPESK